LPDHFPSQTRRCSSDECMGDPWHRGMILLQSMNREARRLVRRGTNTRTPSQGEVSYPGDLTTPSGLCHRVDAGQQESRNLETRHSGLFCPQSGSRLEPNRHTGSLDQQCTWSGKRGAPWPPSTIARLRSLRDRQPEPTFWSNRWYGTESRSSLPTPAGPACQCTRP